MKVAKIFGEEKILKFNIGVLRRSAKALGIKTPELFTLMQTGDMEVGIVLIGECVRTLDRKFDVYSLDDLSINEYTELFGMVMDLIDEGMPEADETEKK